MGNHLTSSGNQRDISKFEVFLDIPIDEAKALIDHFHSDVKEDKVLVWSKYFHFLSQQLESNRKRNDEYTRKFVHPATLNYVSKCKQRLSQNRESTNDTSLPTIMHSKNDYYTDDSASEASTELRAGYHEEKTSSKVLATKFPNEKSSEIVHPAFLGNSWENLEEFHQRKSIILADRNDRCKRAVEIARKFRTDAVEQLEKRILIQRGQRDKKMLDMETKFEKEKNELQSQFVHDCVGASNDMITMMQDQLDQRLSIIQTAFESEMSYLQKINLDKNRSDDSQLEIRRGELRALIELMEPAAPLADQLERFARIELGRLSTALNDALNHVEKMKSEFLELRNDTLNDLDIENQSAAALKKNRELRSMLNIAETKLKESIRTAKNFEEELLDAEALMQKAIDLRATEDKLSPFFFSFQLPTTTKEKAFADMRAISLALVLLAKGSFHEKTTAVLSVFNKHGSMSDRWEIGTIKNIFRENIFVLQKMNLLSVAESEIASLEEFLVRCFLEITVYRKEDVISLFELQQLVLYSIVRLPSLCKMFQVGTVSPRIASYSIFQIHSMKAISFLNLSTVSVMSVAHSAFFEAIKFRGKLQATQKRIIHDLSLACGANDPYKVDYGLFLSKGMKKSSYRVAPLNNGRDTSLWTYENNLRIQAVTTIQSTVRSFVARRKFERASLEAAYSEARLSALQLAKSKILREFQQRESGKGIGKMKWDAEVRIQQAKYRAQGKTLTRSDTVMLMVESAIAVAQQLVEKRFKDILPAALLQGRLEPVSVSRKSRKFVSSFIPPKVIVNISAKTSTVTVQEDSPAEDHFGFDISKFQVQSQSEGKDINEEGPVESQSGVISTPSSLREITDFYSSVLLRTKSSPNLRRWYHVSTTEFGHGEQRLDQLTRLWFCKAEYFSTSHVEHILALLHRHLTSFKANELLSEFPSKRLLANYVLSNELPVLVDDFVNHFKFRRNFAVDVVRRIREFMLNCDEAGRLLRLCVYFERNIEEGLHRAYQSAIYSDARSFCDFAEQKSSSQHMSLQDFLVADYTESVSETKRYQNENFRLTKFAQDNHRQAELQVYSIHAAYRKMRVQRFASAILSGEGQSFNDNINMEIGGENSRLFDRMAQLSHSVIPENSRYDWWMRMQTLEKLFASSPRLYYQELEQLLTEFTTVATERAKCLVREMFLDKCFQTIPTHSSRPIDGRTGGGISGRGLLSGSNSAKCLFCVDNLFMEICIDGDGSFNGNDEFAAKQASKELLGAQLVAAAGIAKLNAPLAVTVDCHGVRVLVTCRLPIELRQLNDDGAVQNVSHEVVHDLQKSGRFFVNQSRVAHSYTKILAQRLNLAEHAAKGLDDLSSTNTFAAHLKIYKGEDGQFYLRRCRSLLPRELPSSASHLQDTPRMQSVMWRFMRPELTRHLPLPLSVDVGLLSAFHVSDMPTVSEEEDNHVDEASTTGFFARSVEATQKKMLATAVPQFLLRLLNSEQDYLSISWKQFDLGREMHRLGINLRHLGFLRSFLWHDLPGKFSIFHNEKIARGSENLDQEVCTGDFLQLGVEEQQLDDLQEHDAQLANKQQSQNKSKSEMIFEVGDMSMRKSRRFVPVTALHSGESVFNLRARSGKLLEARNRRDLDLLVLGEMVTRALKQLIRCCWRIYLRKNHTISTQFQRRVICFFLNLLCSSEEGGGVFGSEMLFNALRERFGTCSVHLYERGHVISTLQPGLRSIVCKLCHMLGVRLAPLSLTQFMNCPVGFHFDLQDIVEITEVVKSSFSYLPLLRAANLSFQGDDLLKKSFSELVLADEPTAFFKLSERKGATVAQNCGSLTDNCNGKYSDGCLLQEDGPIVGEKFVKSVGFSPIAETTIDVPFHRKIVAVDAQQPFSAELYFCVAGGRDVARTIMDCGRFQIGINRENRISIVVYESLHSVNLVLDEIFVPMDRWFHLGLTFDGVNLQVYIDGCEVIFADLVDIFGQKQRQFDATHAEALRQLEEDEEEEKRGLLDELQEQAATFFATKEGQKVMRDLVQQFLDKNEEEDADVDGNVDDEDHAKLLRERRNNATKAAKELYLSQQHEAAVRALHERFKQYRLDLEDRRTRTVDQGKLHAYQHLRIGASLPDANNRQGSAYFVGRISSVCIYDKHLSSEQVRAHYLASRRDCRRDAFRLFSEAVSLFAVAWKQYNGDTDAPHISDYLQVYSHSLCQLFHAQYEEKIDVDRTVAKASLVQLVEIFSTNMMPSAIAEILRHLPREPDFAEVVIAALLALKRTDKNYLLASGVVRDPNVIRIPFDFALITPAPRSYEALQAAAFLLQQVARDRTLAFAYSDAVDLHWIVELYSPAAVVSVALTAHEDGQFKVLSIKHAQLVEQWQLNYLKQIQEGKQRNVQRDDAVLLLPSQNVPKGRRTDKTLYAEANVLGSSVATEKDQELTLLSDIDVQTLAEHLPLLQGVDFSHCGRGLSDTAIGELARFAQLRFLVLDSCSDVVTDDALRRLKLLAPQLEILSLADLARITDDGILDAFSECSRLVTVVISGSIQVTSRAICRILQRNSFLTSLGIARLPLTDRCINNFADALTESDASLFNIDMSFCADVTDAGLLALLCPAVTSKLRSLNVQSCQRLTWRSVSKIFHSCWQLERVELDDVYLLRDQAVTFDNLVDGRTRTQEEMMSRLQRISVATCHDVTDTFLQHLGTHCRQLQSLCLRDTGRFTDSGLFYLCDARLCPYSEKCLAVTLTELDLAYAGRFSANGLLLLLQNTPRLNKLNMSGLATLVSDELLATVAHICPGLQSIGLAHCLQITDAALCHLAEFLWIEELNLESCHRITDDGIEVLGEAFSGLRRLNLRKARNVTERSVRFVQSTCRNLESLICDFS